MQKRIITIIDKFPNITMNDICIKLGVRYDDVKAEFIDLLKNGFIIEKMNKTKNNYGGTQIYPVYSLGSKSLGLLTKNDDEKIELEKRKKIFVSHSSTDSRLANKFIDEILVNIIGLNKSEDIFYTSHPQMGVKPRKNFRNEIKLNLKNSKIYIAFVSQRFKESEMCLSELGAAWILDLPVFQLAVNPIKKSECSYVFNVDQASNLTNADEMIELIHAIREALGISQKIEIEKNKILKTTKSLSSINSNLKKSLSKSDEKPKKKNNIKANNNELNSEEILLKTFPLISKTNLADKTINPEFLYNEIGSFMIWIDYKGDDSLGNHAYIVAHSGNGGESIIENEYKYENAWAIRRTIIQKNPKKMSWEFFSTDENCAINSIKSDRRLNPGKHLFSVSWNRKNDVIMFYIDRKLVGTSKFICWPRFVESNMSIGTWPTYKIHHYINTKVGRVKILHNKEISTKDLDHEIKSFV